MKEFNNCYRVRKLYIRFSIDSYPNHDTISFKNTKIYTPIDILQVYKILYSYQVEKTDHYLTI